MKYCFYQRLNLCARYNLLCLATDTVRKEAATIMAVFPSPNDVMSILVQVPCSFCTCHYSCVIGNVLLTQHFYRCLYNAHNFYHYVQRVLEQRVTAILDKLLVKPSLVNLPPMEEGGLLLVSLITAELIFLTLVVISANYETFPGLLDETSVSENACCGI